MNADKSQRVLVMCMQNRLHLALAVTIVMHVGKSQHVLVMCVQNWHFVSCLGFGVHLMKQQMATPCLAHMQAHHIALVANADKSRQTLEMSLQD